MPIYEYECNACGHRLEAFQKMSDAVLKSCPECHKEALQKLVSAAGFQLKGTGWYATDFRNSGNKKPEPKEQSTDKGTEGSKTDSGSSTEKKE
ncbi:MAG: zinc ribbon domain-containing protein [Gammaproteobacteria bacterium]